MHTKNETQDLVARQNLIVLLDKFTQKNDLLANISHIHTLIEEYLDYEDVPKEKKNDLLFSMHRQTEFIGIIAVAHASKQHNEAHDLCRYHVADIIQYTQETQQLYDFVYQRKSIIDFTEDDTKVSLDYLADASDDLEKYYKLIERMKTCF